jgi:hypothetical protein
MFLIYLLGMQIAYHVQVVVCFFGHVAVPYLMWLSFLLKKRDRQCTCNATLRCVRATIVAIGKAISIAYSECVFVELGIQHAMRMRNIAMCGLPDPAVFFHVIS